MTKDELGKKIFNVCNLHGNFTLRSGQQANTYFDKYLFEANPALLKQIARHLIDLLPESFDKLAGLEMGGIPIATALSLESGVPTLFVRKSAKDYGTRKLAEGGEVAGQTLVIVEDVVTSGGAVIDAVNALRAAGATISCVLCVIDREAGGRENLENLGLSFRSLYTKSTLESYC